MHEESKTIDESASLDVEPAAIPREQLLVYLSAGASLESFAEFATDEEVVRVAVSRDSSQLQYAGTHLRNNEQFVLSLPPSAWKYASGRLIALFATRKKQRAALMRKE